MPEFAPRVCEFALFTPEFILRVCEFSPHQPSPSSLELELDMNDDDALLMALQGQQPVGQKPTVGKGARFYLLPTRTSAALSGAIRPLADEARDCVC